MSIDVLFTPAQWEAAKQLGIRRHKNAERLGANDRIPPGDQDRLLVHIVGATAEAACWHNYGWPLDWAGVLIPHSPDFIVDGLGRVEVKGILAGGLNFAQPPEKAEDESDIMILVHVRRFENCCSILRCVPTAEFYRRAERVPGRNGRPHFPLLKQAKGQPIEALFSLAVPA